MTPAPELTMLPLLLALAPLLAGDTPLDKPPDAAVVKATVADLEKAFKDGDAPQRVKSIEAAAHVLDAEVVDRIAKALRDKESDVQKAAIEALRMMGHPSAVKDLEDAAKHEPRLTKDVELHAAVLRALGQHGSPSSIDILADDFWSDLDERLMEARILSLGRIRSKAAVEKLIDLMKTRGPLKIQPQMRHFRIALIVLTGADQGTSQEGWLKWWNDNHGKLEVAPKPAALPKQLQGKWDEYWGEAKPGDRPARRGGGDKDGEGKDDPAGKRPGKEGR
jgi:HEAT repeat protein